MALTEICYDNSIVLTMNRGMVTELESIVYGNMMLKTESTGGGGSIPTGGGMAVRISGNLAIHVTDSEGNVINKPIIIS